jgi:hypothetical protein
LNEKPQLSCLYRRRDFGKPPETHVIAPAVATASPVVAEELPPTPEVGAPSLRSVRQEAPSREEIRQAVMANPHATPPPLIAFSVAVGRKMALGLQSEDKALLLFSELEECALGADLKGSRSVQAVCILNAKRLRTKYPVLASRYEGLEQQADPSAVKMMHAAPE